MCVCEYKYMTYIKREGGVLMISPITVVCVCATLLVHWLFVEC